jgi:hypothetical protein
MTPTCDRRISPSLSTTEQNTNDKSPQCVRDAAIVVRPSSSISIRLLRACQSQSVGIGFCLKSMINSNKLALDNLKGFALSSFSL